MSGIQLGSGLNLNSPLPLDLRLVKATTVERNAIPAYQRYVGLKVYVVDIKKEYRLEDGIENTDWQVVEGGGTAELPESQSVMYVSKEGNDSNNGKTISTPKLTIANALIEVADDGTVVVMDSSIYTENIIVYSGKKLCANNATLVGDITLTDNSSVTLFKHEGLLKNLGSNNATFFNAKVAETTIRNEIDNAKLNIYIDTWFVVGEGIESITSSDETNVAFNTTPAEVAETYGGHWEADIDPLTPIDEQGLDLVNEFATEQIITKYSITVGVADKAPRSWVFEGSNVPDFSTKAVLDFRTGIGDWVDGETKTYSYSNTTAYKYYRVHITNTNDSEKVRVDTFKLYATGNNIGGITSIKVNDIILHDNSTALRALHDDSVLRVKFNNIFSQGTNTRAFRAIDGKIEAIGNYIEVDTAYEVETTGTLRLNCFRLIGARIGEAILPRTTEDKLGVWQDGATILDHASNINFEGFTVIQDGNTARIQPPSGKLKWLGEVTTYADIATTFPTPDPDSVVIVTNDENYSGERTWYLYNGIEWVYQGFYITAELERVISHNRADVIEMDDEFVIPEGMTYVVGGKQLDIQIERNILVYGLDWEEVGDEHSSSSKVKFKFDIQPDWIIVFRKIVPQDLSMDISEEVLKLVMTLG